MKWVVAFFFLPFLGNTQGVKLNQFDKFLRQHRVEMEPVTLLSSSPTRLSLAFYAVGPNLFVQVSGSGWGATTIDEGNELVFRLANDSTVAATADGLQTFEPGLERSTYRHRYRIAHAALQVLAQQQVTGLRKFSFKEASDQAVPREQRGALQKAAALFLAELDKGGSQTLTPINVQDVYAHVGDSVHFCTKVYRVHKIAAGDGNFTALETQPSFSEPIVTVLLPAGEQAAGLDPAALLDKEICISGVVAMRQSVPTMTVHNRSQLVVAGAKSLQPTTPTTPGNQ